MNRTTRASPTLPRLARASALLLLLLAPSLPPADAYHLSVGAQDATGLHASEATNARTVSPQQHARGTTPCNLPPTTGPGPVQTATNTATAAIAASANDPFCGKLLYNPGTHLQTHSPTDQDYPLNGPGDTWRLDVVFASYVGTYGLQANPWAGNSGAYVLAHDAARSAGLTQGDGHTMCQQEAQAAPPGSDQCGWLEIGIHTATPNALLTAQDALRATGIQAAEMNGWILPTTDLTFVGFLTHNGHTVDEPTLRSRVSQYIAQGRLPTDARAIVCGYTATRAVRGDLSTPGCQVPFRHAGEAPADADPAYDNPCTSRAYACGTVGGGAWFAQHVCLGATCALLDAYDSTTDYDVWHFVAAPTPGPCNGDALPGFLTVPLGPAQPFVAHDLDVYTQPGSAVMRKNPEAAAGVLTEGASTLTDQTLNTAQAALNQQEATRTVQKELIDARYQLLKDQALEPNYEPASTPWLGLDDTSRQNVRIGRTPPETDPCRLLQVGRAEQYLDPWVDYLDSQVWIVAHAPVGAGTGAEFQNAPQPYLTEERHQDAGNTGGPWTLRTRGTVGLFHDHDDDGAYEPLPWPASLDEEAVHANGAYPLLWDQWTDASAPGACALPGSYRTIAADMRDAGYGPRTGLLQAIYLQEPTVIRDTRTGETHALDGNQVVLFQSQALNALRRAGDPAVVQAITSITQPFVNRHGATVRIVQDLARPPLTSAHASDFLAQCGTDEGHAFRTGEYVNAWTFQHQCDANQARVARKLGLDHTPLDCAGDTIVTAYLLDLDWDGLRSVGPIPPFRPGFDRFEPGLNVWYDVDPLDNDPNRNSRSDRVPAPLLRTPDDATTMHARNGAAPRTFINPLLDADGSLDTSCDAFARWVTREHWGFPGAWVDGARGNIQTQCYAAAHLTEPARRAVADPTGRFVSHLAKAQSDEGKNLIGDPYDLLYQLAREGSDLEQFLSDPDRDGLPTYQEFRWGTIPVLDTTVRLDPDNLTATGILLEWGNDTDRDDLTDLEEYNYWNNWRDAETENGGPSRIEMVMEAYHSVSRGEVVRDPDSLLDPDGDACTTPAAAIPLVAPELAQALGSPEAWRIGRCSHVADDPDSDNDGLLDGEEAAAGRGIGRWASPCRDVGWGEWVCAWEGGSLAWARDSDCAQANATTPEGNVYCVDAGNYHNATNSANGHPMVRAGLRPGTGDGLPDLEERDWWVALSTGDNETVWDTHEERNGWMTGDAGYRTLRAYEVDYDGDGAMPLLDPDSDNDGYTDLQEWLTHHPETPAPPGIERPDCDGARLLPYVPDADYDGLSDRAECELGTDPFNWDTDGDGMPDGWEALQGLDPLDPTDGPQDPDMDALTNRAEYCYKPPGYVDTPPPDRPDGCGPDRAYEAWNPCALNATSSDTDGDGLRDDADPNAAGAALGACDTPAAAPVTWPYPTSVVEHENEDLEEYNETLVHAVTNQLYDASSEVIGQPVTPVELALEAAERGQAILDAYAEWLNETITSTTNLVWNATPVQEFVEVVEAVPQLVDNVVGRVEEVMHEAPNLTQRVVEAINTTEETLQVVNTVRDVVGCAEAAAAHAVNATGPLLDDPVAGGSELAMATLADPAGAAANGTLPLAGCTVRALENTLRNAQTFVNSTLENATAPLRATATETVEEALGKPEQVAGLLQVDPFELVRTENVVPDLTFALTQALDRTVPAGAGKTVWDAYLDAADAAGSHLIDSTHYKLASATTAGRLVVTENIPMGLPRAWNADANPDTGAGANTTVTITVPGADGLVTLTVNATTGDDLVGWLRPEPVVEPGLVARYRLVVQKIEPDQAVPVLVLAFALVPEPGPDGLGATGRVAYLGLDGRAVTATPTDGINDPAWNRSYAIADLPDRLELAAQLTLPLPDPIENTLDALTQRDDTNGVRFEGTFQHDATDRFDALVLAGLETTRADPDRGRVIDPDGDRTAASVLWRGLPDRIVLESAWNRTENAASRAEAAHAGWTVERAAGAADAGGETLLERRTTDGALSRLALVTSSLPTGDLWINRTTLQTGGAEETIETYQYQAQAPVSRAYARLERAAPGDDPSVTRLWFEDAPLQAEYVASTLDGVYRGAASEPVGRVRLLHGEAAACPAAVDGAVNAFALVRPGSGPVACLLADLHRFQNLTLRIPPDGSGVHLDWHRGTGTGPDNAVVWLDTDRWFLVNVTDLPQRLRFDLDRPGPDGLTASYDYDPNGAVGSFALQGRIPATNARGYAELELAVEDLPAHGSGLVNLADRRLDVTFDQPATSVRFGYHDTSHRYNLAGPHVAVHNAPLNRTIDMHLPGFRALHVDASGPGRFQVDGDVLSPAPVAVVWQAPRPHGLADDDLRVELGRLPGPFDLLVHRPTTNYTLIEGSLGPDGTDVSVLGTLADKHYDVTIQGLRTFRAEYRDTEQLTTLTAANTGPVTIRGRVVDVTPEATAYAALPEWAEDGLLDVTDPTGARSLAFRLTGFRSADIALERRWDQNELVLARATVAYQYEPGRPRPFLLHQAAPVGPDVRWLTLEARDLPGVATAEYRPGQLTWTASDAVAEARLSLHDPQGTPDDPGGDLRLDATLARLPTDLTASWRPAPDQVFDARVNHTGTEPVAVDLELRKDSTQAGRQQYLRVHAEDVPQRVHARYDNLTKRIVLTSRDPQGHAVMPGWVRVQWNGTGTLPTVPVKPVPEFTLVDYENGRRMVALSLDGPTSVYGNVTKHAGDLRVVKRADHPFVGMIRTGDARVEADLDPLPAGLVANWRATRDGNTLTALEAGLDATSVIERAELDVRLERDHLRATASGLLRLTASWNATRATVTASPPVALDLTVANQALATPLVPPARRDTHYLFLDDRTSANNTAFRARAWGLANVTLDQDRGLLRAQIGNGERGFEARLETRDATGTLAASRLPSDLWLNWTDRDGFVLNHTATGVVPRLSVDLDLTRGVNRIVGSGGVHVPETVRLRGNVTNLPARLDLGWKRATFTLDGSAALGLVDLLAQNVTGERSGSAAATLPADRDGVLLVNDPDVANATWLPAGLDPRMMLAHVRASGLHHMDASWSATEGRFDGQVLRDAQRAGHEPGRIQLVNRTTLARIDLDQLPTSVERFTLERSNRVDAVGHATSQYHLQLNATDALGSGEAVLMLADPLDPRLLETNAQIRFENVPAGLRADLVRETGPDGLDAVGGYTALEARLSAAGATLTGDILKAGNQTTFTLDGLPARLLLNITGAYDAGIVDAFGGDVGRIDLRHHAADRETVPELPGEGLLVTNRDDSGVAAIGFERLQQARWNLTRGGHEDGSFQVQLRHADAPKPVEALIETAPRIHNPDGQGPGVREVDALWLRIDALPSELALNATRRGDTVTATYDANAIVPLARAYWSRFEPTAPDVAQWPAEYIDARVTDVGAGRTTLEARWDRDLTAAVTADQPPRSVHVFGRVRDAYLNATLEGLPATILFQAQDGFTTGVATTNDSGRLGLAQITHASCVVLDSEGRCAVEPPMVTRDAFPADERLIVYGNNTTGRSTSFVHVEQLEDATWFADNPIAPGWIALRASHALDEPAVNVTLLGLGRARDADLRVWLRSMPSSASLLTHLPVDPNEGKPWSDRSPTLETTAPPPGFSAPAGVAVGELDILVSVQPGPGLGGPFLDLHMGNRSLRVENLTLLPPGHVWLRGQQDGAALSGFNGTMDLATAGALPALDVTYSQLANATVKPQHVRAHLENVPPELGVELWTTNAWDSEQRRWVDRCGLFDWADYVSPACRGGVGVTTSPGAVVGRVDVFANLGRNGTGRLWPVASDLPLPGRTVRSTQEHVQVVRDDATGGWRVSFELEDLGTARLRVGGAGVEAAIVSHARKDVDVILGRVEQEGQEHVLKYATVRVRELEGRFAFGYFNTTGAPGGPLRLDARVEPVAGAAQPVRVYVQGTLLPQRLRGLFDHPVQDYVVLVEGLRNRFGLEWDDQAVFFPDPALPPGHRVSVDGLSVDRVEAEVHLLPKPAGSDAGEGGCPRGRRPWVVEMNEPGSAEGIGMVQFSALTPRGAQGGSVSWPQRVTLFRSESDGAEEVAFQARLNGVRHARAEAVPSVPGQASCLVVEARMELAPWGSERPFAFVSRDRQDETRVWSRTLPDDVRVLLDTGAMESWGGFENARIEVWGRGGVLDSSCLSLNVERCWTIRGAFPILRSPSEIAGHKIPHATASDLGDFGWTLPEGALEHKGPGGPVATWRSVIGQVGEATLKAAAECVSVSNALNRSSCLVFKFRYSSPTRDMSSRLSMEGTCQMEADLDNVPAWDGVTPWYADCQGRLSVAHLASDYALRAGNDGGRFAGDAVWLGKEPVYDPVTGEITGWKNVIYRYGPEEYVNPSLWARARDLAFSVPACTWGAGCWRP